MLPGMLPPKTLVIYTEIANRNFSINHYCLVFEAGHVPLKEGARAAHLTFLKTYGKHNRDSLVLRPAMQIGQPTRRCRTINVLYHLFNIDKEIIRIRCAQTQVKYYHLTGEVIFLFSMVNLETCEYND